jgi:adenosylhomocysteine nucleosidase
MTQQWARVVAVVFVITTAGCAATPSTGPRPIVMQGAMRIEVEKLVGRIDNAKEERISGWTFWRGTLDGYPVVVSKTLKGMSNAAAATVMAVEHFHPLAIINQGTAGGHDPTLQLYDIVIGASSVNLGAFRSPFRPVGAGSNTLDWTPLNLMASEGSAGNDPNARTAARFPADPSLLSAARNARSSYTQGRVVEGVIGSSDVWNDELDRIARLHEAYGSTVEEMETASAAQIAGFMNVPFLGIRVVSDNITNGVAYNPKTSEACEDFAYEVLKARIAMLQR